MNFYIDIERSASEFTILCIGDSITYGRDVNGGYRLPLQNLLSINGIYYDFVGPNTGNSVGMSDPEHAGYSGYRIDEIRQEVEGFEAAQLTPTAILLDVGTNDILQNFALPTLNNRLDDFIAYLLATYPDAHIYVATIGPLGGSHPDLVTYRAHVLALNIANVTPVDMASALTLDMLADSIHPNATGYGVMANTWYAALTT